MATKSDLYVGACAATPRSGGSKKRALPTAVPPLPEAVAWLEHVMLEMRATQSRNARRRATVEYELTVHYTPKAADQARNASSWAVTRSLDQYAAFQKLLLKKLQIGHSCHAECAWLYSVVKNHFPKTSFFSLSTPAKVEARRQALVRVFTTLQASLLNRGNHGCAVLLKDVSRAFSAFIVGSSNCTDALESSSSERSTRGSFFSETSAEEEESEDEEDEDSDYESGQQQRGGRNMVLRLATFAETCGVCHSSLDVEEDEATTCVTTAFGCGHQFHDACMLAILDEGVRCPTCGHHERL